MVECPLKQVQEIAREIVNREGGFVDDPDDPGGATNFGVTFGTLRRLGLDLNEDGKINTSDVRALSQDKAVEIFLKHYFYGPRISKLPEELWPTVFDMQVNSGSNAARILQKLFRKMGYDIAVDGVIGPQTIRTADRAMIEAGVYLVDAYGIERRNFYYRIADKRAGSRKFAKRRDGGKGGWITRAEEFISKKYHLSSDQHKERVKSWG